MATPSLFPQFMKAATGGGSVTYNRILLSELEFGMASECEAVVDTAEVQAQVDGEITAVVETPEIDAEVEC